MAKVKEFNNWETIQLKDRKVHKVFIDRMPSSQTECLLDCDVSSTKHNGKILVVDKYGTEIPGMYGNNHKSVTMTTSDVNATDLCLSIKEDYRRGSYYVKHAHQLFNVKSGKKLYQVFKDNPYGPSNWRGNRPVHVEPDFHGDALDRCIEWINNRRCFKSKSATADKN